MTSYDSSVAIVSSFPSQHVSTFSRFHIPVSTSSVTTRLPRLAVSRNSAETPCPWCPCNLGGATRGCRTCRAYAYRPQCPIPSILFHLLPVSLSPRATPRAWHFTSGPPGFTVNNVEMHTTSTPTRRVSFHKYRRLLVASPAVCSPRSLQVPGL